MPTQNFKEPVKASIEDNRYISVSELNQLFNITLEHAFPEVCFTGEISQVTPAGSGHLYLKIKDANSQISAVAWRSYAQNLKFRPEPGMMVLCHGRPNIYQKSGSFQVVLSRLLQAGEGLLQKKFLELKQRLEVEGLFSPARKRPLPFLPKAVGVVTSKSGAVIHDVMVKIRERMPSLIVFLVDVRVQGPGAAQEIADGIRLLNDRAEVDVIIVARGGGSLEDLWAFNEEPVVRAIFGSNIPVVSGVGHEVDVTLADLAADVRAPTPTAAAELVVPRRDELLRTISQFESRLLDFDRWLQPIAQGLDDLALRLGRRMLSILEERRLRLQSAESRLQTIQPSKLLSLFGSRIDLLEQRLYGLGNQTIAQCAQRLDKLAGRLDGGSPAQRLTRMNDGLTHLHKRLGLGIIQRLKRSQIELEKLAGQLEVVSPRRVLKRGFSIVEHDGQIITSASKTREGQELDILMYEGRIKVGVMTKTGK